MAEHHRNQPLCSLLDSDANAETSVDTGVDPTETAAYAGEHGGNHRQFRRQKAFGTACRLHNSDPAPKHFDRLHVVGCEDSHACCISLVVLTCLYSNPHNCCTTAETLVATPCWFTFLACMRLLRS
jgi:hypothetical protein